MLQTSILEEFEKPNLVVLTFSPLHNIYQSDMHSVKAYWLLKFYSSQTMLLTFLTSELKRKHL